MTSALPRRGMSLLLVLAALIAGVACGGGGGGDDDDADASVAPDGNVTPDAPPGAIDSGPLPDAAPFSVQLLATQPPSPAPDVTPDVLGVAGAGCVTAEIYKDSSEVLGMGPVNGGGFQINITVPINATTTLTARCRDMSGTASPFSDPLTYQHDDLPPPAPVIVGTAPSPPSPERRPSVIGTVGSADCAVVVIRDATGAIYGEDMPTAGTFSVLLTSDLPAETTTTLLARCQDLAGNESGNSNPFDYMHSSTAPIAPVITGSTPAPPSPDAMPTVMGTVAGGTCATIEVWKFGAGVLATTTPAAGAFSAPVVVDTNATTDLRARCLDGGGVPSGYSGPFLYTHDSMPPGAPTISGTAPLSPSSDMTPDVSGAAPAGCDFVDIRDGGGTVLASGAPAGTAFNVNVPVAANATSSLTARCRDAAGNTSADSAPVTYIHDGTNPPVPVLNGTTPPSPSSTLMPQVTGTVGGADCTTVEVWDPTVLLGSGPVAGGAWGVTVTVASEATTTLRARCRDAAGNTSAFSSTIDYTHSGALPGPPTLLATNPTSPSNMAAITVTGTNPTTMCAVVEIWNDMLDPLGEAAPTGATFSVMVTAPTNTTTQLRGRCRAAGGTQSGFSGPLAFTHDTVAPGIPAISSSVPASPGNDLTPNFVGTVPSMDCAIVEIWNETTGVYLAEGPIGPGLTFTVTAPVNANTTTSVGARCRDLAGNVGAQSPGFSYQHDGVAPSTPLLTGTTPTSPSGSTTPTVNGLRGAANTDCTYIQIWNDMTSMIMEQAQIGPSIAAMITVAAGSTTTLRARCRDNAGNQSGFSGGLVYTNDSTGPMAPLITSFSPPSPSNDTTPTVNGTAADATCVSVEVWVNGSLQTTATPSGGSWSVPTLFLTSNFTNIVTARCVDAALNVSPFTVDHTYVTDNTAPPVPTTWAFSPTSPSTILTPEVYGSGTVVDCQNIDIWRDTPLPTVLLDTAPRQADGTFSAFISVAANTTTSIKLRCRDGAGNISGFGATQDFTNDTINPATPSLTSPPPGATTISSNQTPTVMGTNSSDCAVVEIWNNMATKLGENAAGPTTFSFAVTLPTANLTYQLRARCRDLAGNFSGYGSIATYVHDNVAPTAPDITGTTPASPSNSTNPTVNGTSPMTDCPIVELWRGLPGAMGSTHYMPDITPMAGAWSKAIVLSSGTWDLYARCKDDAGTYSANSTVEQYTCDTTAPTQPNITAMDPAFVSFPTATGTQPSDCVFTEIWNDDNGAFQGSAASSGTTFSVTFTVLAQSGGHYYKARCRDAAGNFSALSGAPFGPYSAP